MTCTTYRDDLGAYVLETLSPAESAALGQHLQACAECRAELADLAPLRQLLSRTTAADVVSAAGPAPDLVSKTLAAVRARRRRRWTGGLAAACVIVATAGGAAALVHRPAPPPSRIVVEAVDATSHVHARVSYLGSAAGTNLWLSLDGVNRGEHCQLIAIGANGSREVAATWEASYQGQATVQGMTALAMSDLRGFEITTTGGRHLVSVDVATPA